MLHLYTELGKSLHALHNQHSNRAHGKQAAPHGQHDHSVHNDHAELLKLHKAELKKLHRVKLHKVKLHKTKAHKKARIRIFV